MNVEEKIKKWIEKKNKNLEIIQEKLDDEYQKNCTFAPSINVDKKSMIKRNFDQFYYDQESHKKKITEKITTVNNFE